MPKKSQTEKRDSSVIREFLNFSERHLGSFLSPYSNESMVIQKAFAIFITVETIKILSVADFPKAINSKGVRLTLHPRRKSSGLYVVELYPHQVML